MDATAQSQPAVLRYRFGPYEVDTSRNELRKFGLRIPLERKPWQVLIALLRRPGNLVSRLELRRALWGADVFVDFEHGLNVAITKLRAALSDSAETPAYVETVAGEGYRFVGDVEIESTASTDPAGEESCIPQQSEQSVAPAYSGIPAESSMRFVKRLALLTTAVLALIVGSSSRNEEAPLPPRLVTVLIGAFQNATDEPVLDGTLHFALQRELSNSGSVRVISPERLQDILKLMRHPGVSEPDRALGLDICRRTPGVRALIIGRAQKVGNQYLLTAEIIDPADGTTLRAEESQASRQRDILGAIHSLAAQVRSDMVNNLSAFSPSPPSFEHVTTPSLHALQLYSEANDLMIRNGPIGEDIVALLQQAAAEDPDFASAHLMLAHLLRNMGRRAANEHFERALALANTTSERERLFIRGSYYDTKIVTPGDAASLKAAAAYEELLRHYPDDFWAIRNLAGIYRQAGRIREASLLQARKVESRPESKEEDMPYLWRTLLAVGETSAADRLVALCNARRDIPQCMELLIARDFMPVWHAIRLGQPEEALQLAEGIRDKYSTAGQVAASLLQSTMSDVYGDLGILPKDLELARNSADPNVRFPVTAIVAYFRGDRAAENSALSEWGKHPDIVAPVHVMRLAALGRFRDAQIAIVTLKKSYPAQIVHLSRGYVELGKGNISDSLHDLREGDDFYKQQHFPAMCKTSDHLATALERLGRTDEAIQVLVEAEAELANMGEGEFVDFWNLIARQHLARLYRNAGKIPEATAIEAELRTQLRLSEPDHIVLKTLPPALAYQVALH